MCVPSVPTTPSELDMYTNIVTDGTTGTSTDKCGGILNTLSHVPGLVHSRTTPEGRGIESIQVQEQGVVPS